MRAKRPPTKPTWQWSPPVACDAEQLREILGLTPARAFDLDSDGLGAIHVAAGRGAAEAVDLLLERGGPRLARMRSKAGYTPAMMAAGKGHPGVLAAILGKARGCVLDDVDLSRRGALEYAIVNGQEECARMLLPLAGEGAASSSGGGFAELARAHGMAGLASELLARGLASREQAGIERAAPSSSAPSAKVKSPPRV